MSTDTNAPASSTPTEPLEGQMVADGTGPTQGHAPKASSRGKAKEPAPVTQAQSILYSKGDIAELVGMSTQALANRASRDDGFPKPTYTNANGTVQLYTKDDIKAIHEFLTRPDRERLDRLNDALKKL